MTTLIFVRHGQSQANLDYVFAGHIDTPLTELGVKQAENTAQFLKDFPIERIYASALCRARITAEGTARLHGLSVIPDPAWREVEAGKWEGRPYAELLDSYGADYRTWIEDCGNAHPDGGESVVALSERIYAAFDRLLEENRGKCVAVFSHATPIRLLSARWLGIPVKDLKDVPFSPNASVSIVDVDEEGTLTIRMLGYDGHQGDCSTALKKGIV